MYQRPNFMNMRKSSIQILAIAFLFSACEMLTGKEIARFPVNAISTEDSLIYQEQSLDLKKGEEIAIWSDMDIEYEGPLNMRFRIQIVKDGKEFGGMEIDPTDKNITVGEVRTSLMDKTSWSFSGKNKSVTIEEDGNYTFKAFLVSTPNKSLKINKAELVFKK